MALAPALLGVLNAGAQGSLAGIFFLVLGRELPVHGDDLSQQRRSLIMHALDARMDVDGTALQGAALAVG